jgi:hypothetical protein
VAYSLDIDRAAQASIDVLPARALAALAEVFVVLELSPWSGRPVNPEMNPDGPVRVLTFDDGGLVTYLILEELQRVDVLVVAWAR